MLSWDRLDRLRNQRGFKLAVLILVTLTFASVFLVACRLTVLQLGLLSIPAGLLILVLAWLFITNSTVRKALGEDRKSRRTTIHWWTNFLVLSLGLPAFTLYILIRQVIEANAATQVSVTLIAPVLGGLALSAASGFGNKQESQQELLCVAQKFIMATIFLAMFFPLMFLVGEVLKVDPLICEFTRTGAIRALYFWCAATGFYGGIILFLFGLVDLVFALVGLRTGATD